MRTDARCALAVAILLAEDAGVERGGGLRVVLMLGGL